MSKLMNVLKDKEFSLFVSLPSNSMELAQAAIEGGADVIKVHMNVEHRASGNSFGSLRDNQHVFENIVRDFQGPVGIVPGDSILKVTQEEIDALIHMGIDFLSLYGHDAPAYLLSENRVSKMIAINHSYSWQEIESYNSLPINVLEASVIPGDQYGTPLSVRDLMMYQQLTAQVTKPIIVPTQRKIGVDDLEGLLQTGVKGVMIGAIVTGADVDSIYQTTKTFRKKIDLLLGDGSS
jgi:hypothetical protein